MMSIIGFLVFGSLTGLLPVFIVALIIYAVIKALVNKGKKPVFTPRSRAEVRPIVLDLQDYFRTNERLQIEDDVYIEPSDRDDVQLTNLNLFMRGEFIATLADYRAAFPNAFTSFSEIIRQRVKGGSRPAAAAAPVTPQPTPAKDAQYYITLIDKLNDAIPEPRITAQLNDSVAYLRQIKKIEDAFPDAHDKTRKLYQYYLPMLTDILANYRQLSDSASNHAEFKASEDRLLKTVVLINSALKTISTTLVQDHYTDLSVDMKTLEAVLKKDGLVDDGMQASRRPAGQDKPDKQVVNPND